jgi:nucleoside-diphosphate-sugar epimerase
MVFPSFHPSNMSDLLTNLMSLEHVKVNQAALMYRPPLKSPHQAYCASKSQCMKYLNNLQASKTLPFSIAQVIPGTVIGPSEFVTTRSQALMHIDRQTKALLFDEMKPRYAFGFVHVLDCAEVHINALDETKWRSDDLPCWYVAAATSEEGINGETMWARAVEMVEKEFAKEMDQGVFKLGRSKVPINMPYRVDSTETEERLLWGVKMKGFEECVKEVAKWYLSLKDE